MKRLLFRKRMDSKKRIKVLIFGQKFEDSESKTRVRKTFSYKVHRVKELTPEEKAQEIVVRKEFDTKKGIEKLNFKVKGYYYITHERVLFKVNFRHTLSIKIEWNLKNFSPKKSEILTK